MTTTGGELSTVKFEPYLQNQQSVKIIGLGGVGSIVAKYASIMLCAISKKLQVYTRLVLIDGDTFESKNVERMFFDSYGNKAEVVREELERTLLADSLDFYVESIPDYITDQNRKTFIQSGDIVILAVDNHATRKLVSDWCDELFNICLISGGNDGVGPDSSGQMRAGIQGNVQVYLRVDGNTITPSLTEKHPEIKFPKDKHPEEEDCFAQVLSQPQILPANLQVASSILSTLWLYICRKLPYAELVFDISQGRVAPVPRPNSELENWKDVQ